MDYGIELFQRSEHLKKMSCRIETKTQHWNYQVPQTSTFKMVVSVGWLQIITPKMEGWNHDSMTIHQEKRLLFTVPGKKSRIELLGTVEWKHCIIQPFRIIGEQKITPCEGSGDQTDYKKDIIHETRDTRGGLDPMSFFCILCTFKGGRPCGPLLNKQNKVLAQALTEG